ncbi:MULTISPECIES: LysR family transcriptional regulator [Sorangium]|uniref:LysR family transcriptional regulator n=1 Tax=Sorangium cellulosum TaxID=56 RepID=A0A4P2R323_SORCE|nr:MULTISPECIES: LysR family transcriptional regulator [Sorangium]AUX37434.1 LysR family transcriptional regulator [Sorangium cellulosum]WCQ96723.1 HTH-type transcriptional regulator YhaJ [Sorangium sp. Soce836]
MHDSITLDQLRTFIAVADEGSFSAAARKLRRVQSAVSHAMANLEGQLGVVLWDRSTRIPALTEHGRVLLGAARRVCADADALSSAAQRLAGGLDPLVSLCVDAVFPLSALVDLCVEFARVYPTVELVVHTETMSAVADRVLDGTCQLGVVGPAAAAQGLERRHLTSVRMVPVAGEAHPLAAAQQREGRVATEQLREHVQIVLSERGGARSPEQAVLSPRTWRVVDLQTKRELLGAGLGWGNLPEHMIREDLRTGRLVRLRPEAWGDDEHLLSLAVVHRPALVLGPAGQWVLKRLVELCCEHVGCPEGPR